MKRSERVGKFLDDIRRMASPRFEQYGIEAKLFDWEPEADCPRKVARNDYDPCGPPRS